MNKRIKRANSLKSFNNDILINNNKKSILKNGNVECPFNTYYDNNLKLSHKIIKRNTQLNIFSPFTNINKNINENNIITISEEIEKLLKKRDNYLLEYNSLNDKSVKAEKTKKFQRNKTLPIIFYNKLNNIDNTNYANKNKYKNNLFLTSSALKSSKSSTFFKPKMKNEKSKAINLKLKKIKSIDEIIKETELKFEDNYKPPKSVLSSLKKLYKNNFKYTKKEEEENTMNYFFINSNLDQKTFSMEKRQAINTSKLKKYSKNKKLFLSPNDGKKLQDEMIKFKKKHYLSTNNLEVLKKFEKDKYNNYDEADILGNINIKKYLKDKDKKPDAFHIEEFCRKINMLNEKVAYKYRYIFAEIFGFNWDNIYTYKKSGRNIIYKNRKKPKFQREKEKQRPDDLFI